MRHPLAVGFMNSALRYCLIGLVLIVTGCVKSRKLTDPLGVWTCNGYETIRYPREDSAKVWTGNTWEWMRSFRVVDSNRAISKQEITVEAGTNDNNIRVTNLIKKSDSTIGGPPTWDNIQTISLNYYSTDSLHKEKVYKLVLAGVNPRSGVTVTLYYRYEAEVISIIYDSYAAGQYGSTLGNTIYLGGKKQGN
jgi:hypothetical protein